MSDKSASDNLAVKNALTINPLNPQKAAEEYAEWSMLPERLAVYMPNFEEAFSTLAERNPRDRDVRYWKHQLEVVQAIKEQLKSRFSIVNPEIAAIRSTLKMLQESHAKAWSVANSLQAQVDLLQGTVNEISIFERDENTASDGDHENSADTVDNFVASAQGAMCKLKKLKEGPAFDSLPKAPKVVVVVQGGNVQSVASNDSNICVVVHDDDNLKNDGVNQENRSLIIDHVSIGCQNVEFVASRDYAEREFLEEEIKLDQTPVGTSPTDSLSP